MKARLYFMFCIALSLSACGFSKQSTFYVLDSNAVPEKSQTLKSAQNILFGIEPVFLPNYLEKPQIIIREPDTVTLTVSEFNRWAESLSAVFPRVLANAISKKMGYPAAKQINLNRSLFPYRIFIEVLRFDSSFNQEAVLDTWWTIMTDSGKLIYRTRSTLITPVGETYVSVVQAQQKLLYELGDVIGEYALKHFKKEQNK